MAESREDREDGYGREDMGGIDEEDMEKREYKCKVEVTDILTDISVSVCIDT